MNDPICAVCGETRTGELRMYNYGVCLCRRCNEIAAHAFIKMHTEKRLKEAERKIGGLKEETKEEYMERVDSERRMKDFDDLIERLDRERAERAKATKRLQELEKAEQDRIAAKRLQEIRDRTAKAAEAAIKFALGTHEALREQCVICGKAVHPSLITRVHGKHGGAPDKLCPDCYKSYRKDKAEEAAQIRMADLSIENNRLRTKLKDLGSEYDRYKTGVIMANWIAVMAGILIGGIMTFLIYK